MRSRAQQKEDHQRLMAALQRERVKAEQPRDSRGKPLDKRSVVCPRCGAVRGEPCRRVWRRGTPVGAMPMENIIHKERREALWKLANQRIEDAA